MDQQTDGLTAPRWRRHRRTVGAGLLFMGLLPLSLSAAFLVAPGAEAGPAPVGAAAAVPGGTLTDTASSFEQGQTITFSYSASTVTSTNWVGIYHPSDTPGSQGSTIWSYTPSASGTVSFSTASLSPGTWVAYLFYDDEYGVMAGPVTFTVTTPPPTTMPSYRAQYTAGPLDSPDGVAVDDQGDLWVADTYANRVVELSPSGTRLRTIGTEGAGPGQLEGPEAVALDGSGHVFVADTGNSRIEEYTTAGTFEATVGGAGSGNGLFADPEGVAVDGSGHLYVADTDGNRIEVFTATGGSFTFTRAVTAGMSDPQGLALDGAGDLWVADNGITDTSADSVAEYSPAGAELTSFGSNTSQFGGMSNPAGVALDGSGHVYVSEPDYHLVQEFSTDGVYLGELGTPSDGRGTLSFPQGLAVDPAGHVFVADSGNDRIAEFALAAPPASTPEAPLAVYLPLGALAIGGAAWAVLTRRPRRARRPGTTTSPLPFPKGS